MIEFREVSYPPIRDLSVTAPDGAVIGILGDRGSGKHALLRLAAGLEWPDGGEVRLRGACRMLGPSDPLNLDPIDALLLDHTLSRQDAFARAQAAVDLEKLRRAGTTVLLVSHEPELLLRLSDEIWWMERGRLAAKGDPREVLATYQRHLAERLRSTFGARATGLFPSLRRGDGRARVVAIETLDAQCRPTMVWSSGEPASVRVTVRFRKAVEDPVVGIMIRTRIGFEVYGTNTELEKVKLGPCVEGDTVRVTFSFRCDLCPQEYTLTAASHDPDGVWHDWLEDAVALSVADVRYTAGVANLRAQVSAERV